MTTPDALQNQDDALTARQNRLDIFRTTTTKET